MTRIRVIFDGKAFVPQQPVTLAEQAEAWVFVEQEESLAQAQLDNAVREYYQHAEDQDDAAWGSAAAPQSHRAWDEE